MADHQLGRFMISPEPLTLPARLHIRSICGTLYAAISIPTPDHYLPLLYVLAAGQKDEIVRFPIEGVDGGSISMLAVQVG